MRENANDTAKHGQAAQPLERLLPELDRQRNCRIPGQTVLIGVIAKSKNGNDAGAANAGWIVHGCLSEPGSLQLGHALVGRLEHLVFRAELQATGGARFNAGPLEAKRDAVSSGRAFVNFLGLSVELGDVKRATSDAVAAANTVLLLEIDDAVVVLHDGAWRGASFQASGLGTVHALVFAHQPMQARAALVFVEFDQVPEVGRGAGQGLVSAHLHGGFRREVVPLLTGYLASLAADTCAGVDQLADYGSFANTGRSC